MHNHAHAETAVLVSDHRVLEQEGMLDEVFNRRSGDAPLVVLIVAPELSADEAQELLDPEIISFIDQLVSPPVARGHVYYQNGGDRPHMGGAYGSLSGSGLHEIIVHVCPREYISREPQPDDVIEEQHADLAARVRRAHVGDDDVLQRPLVLLTGPYPRLKSIVLVQPDGRIETIHAQPTIPEEGT